MADIKLFQFQQDGVHEITAQSVLLEKSIQNTIEKNLEALLGIRFLASEYATGKTHRGRIDTLGLDENGCPVIIEYKRSQNENVISQGLYYLDWLMDHKAELTMLVTSLHGKTVADAIEWSSPRLLCIAGDFTKYDEHAVQQIERNIELIRYRSYGEALLLFELVNATSAEVQPGQGQNESGHAIGSRASRGEYKTVTEHLADASPELCDRYESLKAFLTAMGDDVQLKVLKYYIAFKRIRNFVCVEVRHQSGSLCAYVRLNPDTIVLEPGFTRDVRQIGHCGTGDLEIVIKSAADLERAKQLFIQSYETS